MIHALMHAREAVVYATKIFHHRNGTDTTEHDRYIEAGSVALYFTRAQKADLVMQQKVSHNKEKTVFFLPQVQLKESDVTSAIKNINSYTGPLYTVKIESVVRPQVGVNITFTYNPKKIQIQPSSLLSIARQPGIIFRVLNMQVVQDITHTLEKTRMTKLACRTSPRRVVIDPGHGGSDTGTCGVGVVQEKDVCLSVATLLASVLKKKGYDVLLTRSGDAEVALDDRTTLANAWHADIFVSIHANAADSATASGIETHYAGASLLESLECRAKLHDVSPFFMHLEHDSASLAQSIQTHVCTSVHQCCSAVVNRSTRKSVAQVLVGTRMPSVLVEIGFLTNIDEAKRLATDTYQKALIDGFCDGIVAYFTHG